MNKFNRVVLYIVIFLTLDFAISNLLFKRTNFWSQIDKIYFFKKDWRVKSELYHHDLKKKQGEGLNLTPVRKIRLSDANINNDDDDEELSLLLSLLLAQGRLPQT